MPTPYFISVARLKEPLEKYVGQGLSIHNGWWGAKFGTKAETTGDTMDFKVGVLYALPARCFLYLVSFQLFLYANYLLSGAWLPAEAEAGKWRCERKRRPRRRVSAPSAILGVHSATCVGI